MNRKCNFVSTSSVCHKSEIVMLIDSPEDLHQLHAPKESEVKRLFPDCEKCEYCISLRLVSIKDNADEYDKYLLMRPKFKNVEKIEDHLSEEHDVKKCSNLGYIMGSDWISRLHERSQVGIQDYFHMLTDSEWEKLTYGILIREVLEFGYEINYEVQLHRSCPKILVARPSTTVDKMRRLLESGYLSDFEIVTKDKTTIKVHKAVLAMASPVLKAMFEADMEEKRESLLKLDSLDAKVVKNFINFIYADELDLKTIGDEREMAMELLILADYYQIDSLKFYCENQLTEMLIIDSAVDMLKLSVTYKAQNLRENALRFIGINKTIFGARKDFIGLICSDDIELRMDIMKAFADSYVLAGK